MLLEKHPEEFVNIAMNRNISKNSESYRKVEVGKHKTEVLGTRNA